LGFQLWLPSTHVAESDYQAVAQTLSNEQQPGDVVLLASDGLTGMLEDEQLERILRVDGGPERWVDRMITEANRRGGLDNITAIAVKIETVDGPTGEYHVSSSSGDGMARQA
jgi:protein phosphatase